MYYENINNLVTHIFANHAGSHFESDQDHLINGPQSRKFEGNLAEASVSRSCGGGPGGLLFICLFVCLFLNLAEAAASAASMQFTALVLELSVKFLKIWSSRPSLIQMGHHRQTNILYGQTFV